MLNIIIPMAGAGSRFQVAGYDDPKPLIEVNGQAMLELVINNIRPVCEHRFLFICQSQHVEKYDLLSKLECWAPSSVVVEVDGLTDGPASTVYAAKNFINDDEPVMVANSDQYIKYDINRYLSAMQDVDGLIMTMRANDAKWSFVELGISNQVLRVVEKEVISDHATVGIYNYRSGKILISAIEKMFSEDKRTNGEFYLAPAYDYIIAQGGKVLAHDIGNVGEKVFGLGTPDDLKFYLEHNVSNL